MIKILDNLLSVCVNIFEEFQVGEIRNGLKFEYQSFQLSKKKFCYFEENLTSRQYYLHGSRSDR